MAISRSTIKEILLLVAWFVGSALVSLVVGALTLALVGTVGWLVFRFVVAYKEIVCSIFVAVAALVFVAGIGAMVELEILLPLLHKHGRQIGDWTRRMRERFSWGKSPKTE